MHMQVRTAITVCATTVGLAGFGSRVLLGGWLAMGLTYAIGTLFEAV